VELAWGRTSKGGGGKEKEGEVGPTASMTPPLVAGVLRKREGKGGGREREGKVKGEKGDVSEHVSSISDRFPEIVEGGRRGGGRKKGRKKV